MANTTERNIKPPLLDSIVQCGKLAFDPALPDEARQLRKQEFSELLEKTSVLSLLPVLNLLVQPERVHAWLRAPIISALAKLPLRRLGVQHTIEFVISVHPTTSGMKNESQAGRGSTISHEALNACSRLLSSPPAGMQPEAWFQGLAPQLFSLLQGDGEPGMDSVAAFVIGFGILGRRQYGAPGMPGWKAFVEPIFRAMDPSLVPSDNSHDSIISLGTPKVLANTDDIATALSRLTSLISSHPNPSLTRRLLTPIVLPLWALSSWPQGDTPIEQQYRRDSKYLLKTLIQLTIKTVGKDEPHTGSDIVNNILRNLLFEGRSGCAVSWIYACDAKSKGIQIQKAGNVRQKGLALEDILRIDNAVMSFVDLLDSTPDLTQEISKVFLQVFRRWESSSHTKQPAIFTHLEVRDEIEDVERQLIGAKLIQKLIEAFPDKLIDNSTQVLEIVDKVLVEYTTEGSNEDIAAVALSLLNIVLTSNSFKPFTELEELLNSVQGSLEAISRSQSEVSSTANNLLLLIKFRCAEEEATENQPSDSANEARSEERKLYELGLSYLTASDSPPPVRAHGLELLSKLIRGNSPLLDIPSLLLLLISLLQDDEEYIYLHAVKTIVLLSEHHPKSTLKDLLDHYVDPREEAELDQRLRLGEALVQVIQARPSAFNGDIARSVCDGLLFLAGRRVYRREAERKQDRIKNLQQRKNEEASEAWGGDVPQVDEILELNSKEDEQFMANILGGWESKRGSEDVRIRASALSILGASIETNIAGVASQVLSTAIDTCIHILTLELEPEKGILRRAAILTILSFVKALDGAREQGKQLAFGFAGQSLEDLQRILKYIEETDNDGLVRQHAADVLESLVGWQMNMFTPSFSGAGDLQELRGLSIQPQLSRSTNDRGPRIEEIE